MMTNPNPGGAQRRYTLSSLKLTDKDLFKLRKAMLDTKVPKPTVRQMNWFIDVYGSAITAP